MATPTHKPGTENWRASLHGIVCVLLSDSEPPRTKLLYFGDFETYDQLNDFLLDPKASKIPSTAIDPPVLGPRVLPPGVHTLPPLFVAAYVVIINV